MMSVDAAPAKGPDSLLAITSLEALPAAHDKPRIFLGGSIDIGSAPDWQADMIRALADERLVVLNPRWAD
jgi:hypothetical protein